MKNPSPRPTIPAFTDSGTKWAAECRESRLGVLGMPHCWGLIFLFGLLVLSLWRDAVASREHGRTVRGGLVATLLLVAGWLGTAKMVLELCVYHARPEPWPLLVVLGLGVATGARAWRVMAMAILGAALPMMGYLWRRLHAVGLRHSTPHYFFDRIWIVPHQWVAGLIVLGAVLSLLMIAQLTLQWVRELQET